MPLTALKRQGVREPERERRDAPGYHRPEQVHVVVAGLEVGREDDFAHVLVPVRVHGVQQANPLDEPRHRISSRPWARRRARCTFPEVRALVRPYARPSVHRSSRPRRRRRTAAPPGRPCSPPSRRR